MFAIGQEDLKYKIEHTWMTYGNDAEADTMYSAAAVLLQVPSHHRRSGRDAPVPPADGSGGGKSV